MEEEEKNVVSLTIRVVSGLPSFNNEATRIFSRSALVIQLLSLTAEEEENEVSFTICAASRYLPLKRR